MCWTVGIVVLIQRYKFNLDSANNSSKFECTNEKFICMYIVGIFVILLAIFSFQTNHFTMEINYVKYVTAG